MVCNFNSFADLTANVDEIFLDENQFYFAQAIDKCQGEGGHKL